MILFLIGLRLTVISVDFLLTPCDRPTMKKLAADSLMHY